MQQRLGVWKQMKIVSTELSQVFRAYTRQLRGEYDRARSTRGRESVAAGFERVDISDEAKALAQNSVEFDTVDEDGSSQPSEKTPNDEEKEVLDPKETDPSDRE
jgi:hypothetical protein